MRLTLDALDVLDAIDRHGSFAAAAEALHRVPSAITYAVQRLEQDLDVALFDRSGYRAVMTPAARALLEEGRHLLRAAEALEKRVRRVATGWETELSVAVDELLAFEPLLEISARFYGIDCGTRLRFSREVLGGSWDALISGRADLVVGAGGDGPSGGGYITRPFGEFRLVFAVAPQHPLATAREPISQSELVRHRAIAIGDSSRNLPPRTVGLLSGQDILTVPDFAAKSEAQRRGLGVGYLPRSLVEREAAAGRLVPKEVEGARYGGALSLAWRADHEGRALRWFVEALADPALQARMLAR